MQNRTSNGFTLRGQGGQTYGVPPHGLRLGRGKENDVVLDDAAVSRRHATLWVSQGRCYVRDEGSTNGTFVNERRITGTYEMQPGDRLRVGAAVFHLTAEPQREWAMPAKSQPVARLGRPQSTPIAVGGGLLLLALIVGVVLLARQPLPTPMPTPAPTSWATLAPPAASTPVITPTPAVSGLDGLQRAILATVVVIVPVEGSDEESWGSGSIISAEGYILTNLHVIGDETTGELYNRRGLIAVGINSSQDQPPQIAYLAELVKADTDLDLALLRISALTNGDPLPGPLNLTAVPIGDSDTVQIGDTLSVLGFPGLGGETVTLTRGTVSGFHSQAGLARAWIKTDTEINRGNSGGMAINDAGELIGIPTFIGTDVQVTGKLGYIRPVNLAQPLIRLTH